MADRYSPVFALMPEWQGSPASRAMLLVEGAELLGEDLPPSARIDVPVPAHAGDALGTPVARLSSVLAARDAAADLLRDRPEPAITLGGDCASTLAGLERAVQRDSGVAVLWFDAHADLQHPSTSPTGAASGMALRHGLGGGAPELAAAHPASPERTLLVGARDLDPEEESAIAELGVCTLDAAAAGDPAAAVADWLTALGATSVYVHVDLDVLDPAEFSSVHSAVPFGLTVAELTGAIRTAVAAVPLAGAAVCEFAPADREMGIDDAPTVLRVLAALTSGGRA